MGIDIDAQPDKGGQYLNSLAKCVIEISWIVSFAFNKFEFASSRTEFLTSR